MVEAGVPDDLESKLRDACREVAVSMGKSASFGFLPSDPDFDTMTELVCERLFAGEAASAPVRAKNPNSIARRISNDPKVCPVVKSFLLEQKLYQGPAPRHGYQGPVPRMARIRAPLQAPDIMSMEGCDSKTSNELLRNLKAGADARTHENPLLSGVDSLTKPKMSIATLRKAGYDEQTSSAVDSLTNRLSNQPKMPQFPPSWLMAEYAENSKKLGGGGYLKPKPEINYDHEAKKLWTRLNIDPTKGNTGRYNSVDAIFHHPETKATIYVGNEVAAKNLSVLEENRISHIVNCTDSLPNHHEDSSVNGSPISYLRFDICSHRHFATHHQTVDFVEPMLKFVSDALRRGENVMVHCLAGAHRAGTTGIICLMHFTKLSAKEAILMAKQCRPIIEPIGDFPALLARLERGWAQPLEQASSAR